MTVAQTDKPTPRKPLRLWPGVAAAVLLGLVRFVVPLVVPSFMVFGVLGGVVGALVIVIWWLFFSRAAWVERLGAIALMIVALYATSRIIDKSIATGAMGMLFPILAIPVLALAFVAWAVATRCLSDAVRRAAMVATILLACGVWTLVRTGGFTGNFKNDLAWRWAKTPEERLLAQTRDEPATLVGTPTATSGAPQEQSTAPVGDKPKKPPPPSAGAKTGADWPGFPDPIATESSPARISRPTGPPRRRSSCGVGRSDQAGRPSRSAAISSTPRSSAVRTRSLLATRRPPASRCGNTVTRPDFGSRMPALVPARHRRSATVACTH